MAAAVVLTYFIVLLICKTFATAGGAMSTKK